MCGIFGLVDTPWRDQAPTALAALRSRGPDETQLLDLDGVTLGHTRLAVIDIAGGHQPMRSPDHRYTIVFNGEIYNFHELRSELEAQGYCFTTSSDTEVLLHGFAAWGERLVPRLDGMFAFVVWDARERVLFAARDRMGIKPFGLAGSAWYLLPLALVPRGLRLLRDFDEAGSGHALSPVLFRTVFLEAAFGLLLAAGALLATIFR